MLDFSGAALPVQFSDCFINNRAMLFVNISHAEARAATWLSAPSAFRSMMAVATVDT